MGTALSRCWSRKRNRSCCGVEVVFETEQVLASYHTQPTWDVHIVVIPKEHVRTLTEVGDAALLAEILTVAREIILEQDPNNADQKGEMLV